MPEEKSHSHKEKKERHHKHHNKKQQHHRSQEGKSNEIAALEAGNIEEEEEDWDANRERIERICQNNPNNICNDCNNNGTRWASVNHGVFLCIRCSGIHRSMGVHISKVKSTNMDKWNTSEVTLMEIIGNQKGKALYEARLPKGMKPITGTEPETTLKNFIYQKYQEKSFAVSNINEELKRYYKKARYGKKLRKVIGKGNTADNEDAEGDNSQQREETMKALYGVNAEAMSKKSKKVKPIYGTFGVVNVIPDEYEERRKTLFTHFNIMEPSAIGTV